MWLSFRAISNQCLEMNPILPFKCMLNINCSKRNTFRGVYCTIRHFKSDDLPPDDNNKSKKNQIAIDKLNELLKSMKKGNDPEVISSKPIELTQPRQLARKVNQTQDNRNESNKNKQLGDKLANAATAVAQSIGGNREKTESELLNLLRIYNSEPNDLSEKKSQSSASLGDLISGMKIDRTQPNTVSSEFGDVTKAQRVRELLGKSSGQDLNKRYNNYRKPIDNYVPINLFSSEPLNIFKHIDMKKNDLKLHTWDKLEKKSLEMAVTHPPKNIYEQMIMWTEQGKLWNFPINNEQGMDDEKNIFFAEHVFLEPLIDEWCPKKGPIRHFMELVCVGLSKNPFLTIEEKHDHINWFRQYFFEKNQLLNDVGAFQIKSLPENIKEYYKPSIPEE